MSKPTNQPPYRVLFPGLPALLLLASCGWPECDCERANAPCVEHGFLAAKREVCEGERMVTD